MEMLYSDLVLCPDDDTFYGIPEIIIIKSVGKSLCKVLTLKRKKKSGEKGEIRDSSSQDKLVPEKK